MDTDSSRRQAAAFDAVADRYDEVYLLKAGQVIATQWLIDRLPSGGRVLDLGCGTGTPTAAMVTEAGGEVVGIDVSPRMLALARHTVPGGRFNHMDVRDLDSSLGHFDGATAFFSLSMLPRVEIPEVLRRLRMVLRSGTAVAIGMLEGDLDHVPVQFLGEPVRLTARPEDDAITVAEAAGLQVLDVDVEECELTSGDTERQLFLYCITN